MSQADDHFAALRKKGLDGVFKAAVKSVIAKLTAFISLLSYTFYSVL